VTPNANPIPARRSGPGRVRPLSTREIETPAPAPTLTQSRLVAAQRATGAILGALVAALALLTIDRKGLLELGIVVLGTIAGAIRTVNYTLYTGAIAAVVLIANDLSHPADLTEEAERIVFTLIGVGIAILVEVIATKVQERGASKAAS
jgi:uncharacterized membrane protein YccC